MVTFQFNPAAKFADGTDAVSAGSSAFGEEAAVNLPRVVGGAVSRGRNCRGSWPSPIFGPRIVFGGLLVRPSFSCAAVMAFLALHCLTARAQTSERRLRPKIVGKVTVAGTKEAVRDARIRILTGKVASTGSFESVVGKTGADGRYSIGVPLGNVQFWNPELPAGYWTDSSLENAVTSASKPILTKNFIVRRGPIWRIRVWDATQRKPAQASVAL